MSDAINEAVGVLDKKQRLLKWTLTEEEHGKVWQSDLGPRVRARPFLGTLGICPSGEGWMEAWSPRGRTAGNTDCKELVQGTALMLPFEPACNAPSCASRSPARSSHWAMRMARRATVRSRAARSSAGWSA